MSTLALRIEHARLLRAHVADYLAYLGRVRRWMELRGWPVEDPLFRAVTRAWESAQELHVLAHYAACESGVGK